MDQLAYLSIESLQRGRYQPRQDFNPEALQELADSIQEHGIIEPIIVRSLQGGKYEIIAGERRWRGAQLARLAVIPAIVREYSDEQAAEVTLIENIQRENLNPIEEAKALERLLREFTYTHEKVAIAVGKSRAKITNSLRLLHLHEYVQNLLIQKELSEGHGKALASLPLEDQIKFAQQCVSHNWSVRRTEQAVKIHKESAEINAAVSDPNLTRLERIASERFNAEVKVDHQSAQKSGWIRIKYYDNDTLAGILKKMGIHID